MAKKTIVVSDLSGREIEAGTGARVTIRFNDASRGSIVLDVTDDEAEDLGRTGRRRAGRRETARDHARGRGFARE